MTQPAPHIGNDKLPHSDEEGRLARAFDVDTEDHSADEQRAGASQRLAALGEMTSGIAHDFRNLLAVIESGLRLAERSSEQPEKVRAYIAAAREGIDRGVELTSQLLAFAKHQELDAHAGNVNEFLTNFEPFLRYGAGSRVRVVLDLASDVPKCLVDPALFDAAVLNNTADIFDIRELAATGLVDGVTTNLSLLASEENWSRSHAGHRTC